MLTSRDNIGGDCGALYLILIDMMLCASKKRGAWRNLEGKSKLSEE